MLYASYGDGIKFKCHYLGYFDSNKNTNIIRYSMNSLDSILHPDTCVGT
jgi:hypothetical protein